MTESSVPVQTHTVGDGDDLITYDVRGDLDASGRGVDHGLDVLVTGCDRHRAVELDGVVALEHDKVERGGRVVVAAVVLDGLDGDAELALRVRLLPK